MEKKPWYRRKMVLWWIVPDQKRFDKNWILKNNDHLLSRKIVGKEMIRNKENGFLDPLVYPDHDPCFRDVHFFQDRSDNIQKWSQNSSFPNPFLKNRRWSYRVAFVDRIKKNCEMFDTMNKKGWSHRGGIRLMNDPWDMNRSRSLWTSTSPPLRQHDTPSRRDLRREGVIVAEIRPRSLPHLHSLSSCGILVE